MSETLSRSKITKKTIAERGASNLCKGNLAQFVAVHEAVGIELLNGRRSGVTLKPTSSRLRAPER